MVIIDLRVAAVVALFPAQLHLVGCLSRDPARHLGREQLDAVAPRLLGLIHGLIAVIHQLLLGGAVLRIEGHTDAAGDMEMERIRHGKGLVETLVDGLGDGDGPRLSRYLGQQHHEFIPADPGDRVPLPHTVQHALGDGGQQPVACLVPMLIVDRLEVVEIDEQQGKRLSVRLLQ